MESQNVDLRGGWSLSLPGGCNTARNPDGSWSAWDASHVIDLSIIETGGGPGGSVLSAEEMLRGTEQWASHALDGALARVSTDTEVTDTPDGPQPVEWTRVQAAAANTALIMSIGNAGPRDTAWRESIWRTVSHRSN
jgi:hypothetical protein